MKFLIIISTLAVSLLIGFNRKLWIDKYRAFSGISVAVLLIAVFIINFLPSLSTDVDSASYFVKNGYKNAIPILIHHDTLKKQLNVNKYFIENNVNFGLADSVSYRNENLISATAQDRANADISEVHNIFDNFTYPFIPGLEGFIRVFPMHVSFAWVSVLGFLMSLFYSVKYLKQKELNYDKQAFLSAKYGLIFCILATLSGMIWAKHSWGAYWNWDPRELSIFILLSIYLAYFVLRQSITNEAQKAKLSAVYSVFAGSTVPFLIFIVPRITGGLHPGSATDPNSPLLTQNKSMMNTELLIAFSITLFAFTILYFFLYYLELNKKSN